MLNFKSKFNEIGIKNQKAATLFLLAIENNIDPKYVRISADDFEKLQYYGVIKVDYKDGERVYVLDDSTVETDSNHEFKNIKEEIKVRWKEYQDLFSTVKRGRKVGIKTGAMSNEKEIVDKLTRWFKENPSYTFDDVLRATKYYIDSTYKKYGHYDFTRKANYFIFKKEGKDEISDLATFVEETANNDIDDSITEEFDII